MYAFVGSTGTMEDKVYELTYYSHNVNKNKEGQHYVEKENK
jgi:hypothetical protein